MELFLDKQSALSLPSHPPNKISGLEKNDHGWSSSLKGAELWSPSFHGSLRDFIKSVWRRGRILGVRELGRLADFLYTHISALRMQKPICFVTFFLRHFCRSPVSMKPGNPVIGERLVGGLGSQLLEAVAVSQGGHHPLPVQGPPLLYFC